MNFNKFIFKESREQIEGHRVRAERWEGGVGLGSGSGVGFGSGVGLGLGPG